MKTSTTSTDTMTVLKSEDIASVSGGILEKIEKGDEFLSVRDHIIRSINEHLILWDAPGTGWNQYP